MVQPDVLHVWILVPRVLDTGYHLLGNDDTSVLLSSMCRRLSLVVAEFPHKRFYGNLSFHLLLSLLCDEAADSRRRQHFLIFWLHSNYGVPVLPTYRFARLLCLLLVYPKNLQRRQGRLMSESDVVLI